MTSIRKNSNKIVTISLIALLACQGLFWYKTNKKFPELEIVETSPPIKVVKALALGEEEFYFRKMGLELQFMGDTYNRFTPLQNYDYAKLYKWFTLLDELDNKSNFISATAAYYFSLSQNVEDTIYVIQFLREHANKNPKEKWWWLFQATLIASQKLKDKNLALEIAYELYEIDTPLQITKFLPAILLKELGNKSVARFLIKDLSTNGLKIDSKDLPYISFFLEELDNEKK